MSGLSLINTYEDEDNSEESGTEDNLKHIVKKEPLPRPNLSKISAIIKETEDFIDNPDLHSGRIRSFPHIRGNWASFVYISYPDDESLTETVDDIKKSIEKTVDDTIHYCDNFHISLSKTFVLKFHQISSLRTSLQETFDKINRFNLKFETITVYCNEENTRTFVALQVHRESSGYLINISNCVDDVLKEFQLPSFYVDPSFHMSILWVNGNKKAEIEEQLMQKTLFSENSVDPVSIAKVLCKVGNKYFQYVLY